MKKGSETESATLVAGQEALAAAKAPEEKPAEQPAPPSSGASGPQQPKRRGRPKKATV